MSSTHAGGSTPTGSVLYGVSNAGGTYYFDMRTPCPQNPGGYAETDGYPTCASFTPGPYQQTLRQASMPWCHKP